MTYDPVIDATSLLDLYHQSSVELILLDARSGIDAKDKFAEKHLEGAYWIDLNNDLAEIKEDAANGGRHPLPSIEKFAETISGFGIGDNTLVVVYDDKNGANAAARCWWMLRALGHEKVSVLNGGMAAAEKINYPTEAGLIISQKKVSSYQTKSWKLPLSDIDEVKKVAGLSDHRIIDVREAFRYHGESEPIDLVAGHIPGAINIPYPSNLNEEGLFKSAEELKEKYQAVLKDIPEQNIIVHCGSGVTACHSLLAMARAGLKIPKLYVGSWSEWSRREI